MSAAELGENSAVPRSKLTVWIPDCCEEVRVMSWVLGMSVPAALFKNAVPTLNFRVEGELGEGTASKVIFKVFPFQDLVKGVDLKYVLKRGKAAYLPWKCLKRLVAVPH